ncbi:MAG: hypothetical protein QNJ03_00100 [Dinoroseobacter sp.]|nr:hypothetical protein [Dinoroseobacter sp.]
MPDWLTYDFVKDFQTAIVGVIGFTGVILTLLVNAILARHQHERELEAKRRTVRAGILAELHAFKGMVDRNLEHPGPSPGNHVAIPRVRRLVSNHLIGDLGLLPPKQQTGALEGVMAIEDLSRKLVLVASSVSDDHILVNETGHELVNASYTAAQAALSDAIAALEADET